MKVARAVPEKITFNSSQDADTAQSGSKVSTTYNTKRSVSESVLRNLPLTINTKRGA